MLTCDADLHYLGVAEFGVGRGSSSLITGILHLGNTSEKSIKLLEDHAQVV